MLLKKSAQVGGSTLLSRFLGLIREILMAKYLGVDAIAEAFITAFKIPNSLRKIFAEGALSISFIPTFVQLMQKDEKDQVNKLMTLGLLLFEGGLFLFCIFVMWKAEWVIRIIAPGWYQSHYMATFSTGLSWVDAIFGFIIGWIYAGSPGQQVSLAVLFLRILMGFILLLSTSALLSGALQAVHHFFIPAFSPVLLNIFFILGIAVCMHFKLFPTYLCLFIMFGGVAQLLLHVIMYFRLGFALTRWDEQTWKYFKDVWKKFLPCLFGASVMEIYLFIDTSLASFLPTGAIALIYYANRFMQIPLSVFGTALSTILLPQFSRVGTYAPKRLGFYLLESTKLIVWTTLPIVIIMWAVSEKIFVTLFLSHKFTVVHAQQAGIILHAFLLGLCFFSLNKILLNLFYGLHDTLTPMKISIGATIVNGLLSYILMLIYGAYGIALATSICGLLQSCLFLYFLSVRFNIKLYIKPFLEFCVRYSLQLFILGGLFYIWCMLIMVLCSLLAKPAQSFLLEKIGFWLWFMPSMLCFWYLLYKTKRLFKLSLFFLE